MKACFFNKKINSLSKYAVLALILLNSFSMGIKADRGVKLNKYMVKGPSGLRHAYYSLPQLKKELKIRDLFDPGKKRGIIFFPYLENYKKLLYKIGISRYKYDSNILTTSWPILQKKEQIYLPLNILRPILRDLYPDSIQFKKQNILILSSITKRVSQNVKKAQTRENRRQLKNPSKKIFRSSRYGRATLEPLNNIIIDPGHGGKDPGALYKKGKRKYLEKNITLSVARVLKKVLKKRFPEKNIILTRNRDIFLNLERRTELANKIYLKKGGSLFISLHVNSSLSPRTRGIEIYYLSPNKNNNSLRLTEIKEKNIVHSGKNTKGPTLIAESYLLNSQIQRESKILVNEIYKALKRSISKKSFKQKKKQADFMVLRGSLMPAVLFEMGFITNAGDRRKLLSKSYRLQLAEAIANGVAEFNKIYEKFI